MLRNQSSTQTLVTAVWVAGRRIQVLQESQVFLTTEAGTRLVMIPGTQVALAQREASILLPFPKLIAFCDPISETLKKLLTISWSKAPPAVRNVPCLSVGIRETWISFLKSWCLGAGIRLHEPFKSLLVLDRRNLSSVFCDGIKIVFFFSPGLPCWVNFG